MNSCMNVKKAKLQTTHQTTHQTTQSNNNIIFTAKHAIFFIEFGYPI